MKRFNKYLLISGATMCAIKRKCKITDCYVTNSAYEIFYLILWFILLFYKRQAQVRHYRSGTWEKLVKKYGEKCNHCGATERLTIDHILPLGKGGSKRGLFNMQILCAECNQKKGNKI